MAWREEEHPRDDGGRFTDGEKYYPTNSLEPYKKSSYKKTNKNRLSPEQYARWSKMLADGLHGDYIFEKNGRKYITIDNIIVVSSGSFELPRVDNVYRFASNDEMNEFYNVLRKGKK